MSSLAITPSAIAVVASLDDNSASNSGKSADASSQPPVSPGTFAAILTQLHPDKGMAATGGAVDTASTPKPATSVEPKKTKDKTLNLMAATMFSALPAVAAGVPKEKTIGQFTPTSPTIPLAVPVATTAAPPKATQSSSAPSTVTPKVLDLSLSQVQTVASPSAPKPDASGDGTSASTFDPAPDANLSPLPATAGPAQRNKPIVPEAPAEPPLNTLSGPRPTLTDVIDAGAIATAPDGPKVPKDSGTGGASPPATAVTDPTHSFVAAVRETPKPAPSSAPALADQIQNQVSPHLDQLRQVGRLEVQLDLHPPELGRVQLHLAMEDGRVNVRMLVQDDATKRLLDQQQEPLKVRFAEMGVSVGQFDVRRDGGSPYQGQQPAPEPSAQAIQSDTNGTGSPQKGYARVANSNALVDVLA